jgi:hypothetical protein
MRINPAQGDQLNSNINYTWHRAVRSIAMAAGVVAMLVGSFVEADAFVRRGGGMAHRGGAAWRGGGARFHGGGVAWRGGAGGRGWHGGGARWGGWARPGRYWWGAGGAIAAGAAIGVVSAAAAASWAGPAPGPGLCWYYTDPSRTQGFWDACQ